MEVLIRDASVQDAQFLAWAILAATRSHLPKGWFDIALDKPERDCLEFLSHLTIADALSPWHYSRFIIAEGDGRPVAALAAHRSRDAYPAVSLAVTQAFEALGRPSAEKSMFWKRGAYIFRCTTRPKNDHLVIEIAATLPSHRGRHYIGALMRHALARGCANGLQRAEVACFIGNSAAARAYEQFGFRQTDERRDAIFEAIAGAPGILQYTRGL